MIDEIEINIIEVNDESSERKQYAAGWYKDLSNDEYHCSAGYSSSSLKILNEKTFAHLEAARNSPDQETQAKKRGSVLHTLVLEPHLFNTEFAVRPAGLKKPTSAQINAKNPSESSKRQMNDWSAWLKELGDRTEIDEDTKKQAEVMAAKVREHPEVKPYIEGTELIPEQSIFYWYNPEDWDEKTGIDYRIMCKVRPDLIVKGHSIIFDLKSARGASFSEFGKQVKQLGYDFSASMYLDGCNRNREFLKHCGVMAFTDFAWIVVENEPPYEVAVYSLKKEDRESGAMQYHRAVRKLHQYNQSDWKGYGEWDGEQIRPVIREIELPNFKNKIV